MCEYLVPCYTQIYLPMQQELKELMMQFHLVTEAEIFTASLESQLRLQLSNMEYGKSDLSRNYKYMPEVDQEDNQLVFDFRKKEIVNRYKQELNNMILSEYDEGGKSFNRTIIAIALYFVSYFKFDFINHENVQNNMDYLWLQDN